MVGAIDFGLDAEEGLGVAGMCAQVGGISEDGQEKAGEEPLVGAMIGSSGAKM